MNEITTIEHYQIQITEQQYEELQHYGKHSDVWFWAQDNDVRLGLRMDFDPEDEAKYGWCPKYFVELRCPLKLVVQFQQGWLDRRGK